MRSHLEAPEDGIFSGVVPGHFAILQAKIGHKMAMELQGEPLAKSGALNGLW